MTFGRNLKEIRKGIGMTQRELANSIGISRSYLSDLENDYKNPSIRTVKGLALKMKVSINDLINDDINIRCREEITSD